MAAIAKNEPSSRTTVVKAPTRISPFAIPVLTGFDRVVYVGLVLTWLAANYLFWSWWLAAEHVSTTLGLVINSLLIAYDLLIPGWFLFFLGRMREPNPAIAPPAGLRVAMVTTKVPGSEPWDVVETTLRAMLDQRGYPHDVWLLDEGDEDIVRAKCLAMGVHYFSRRNRPEYVQPVWPFKAKTKAGNYNAWLTEIGYAHYDVLVQMDTDHVPQPGYLVEMLRPLADPAVVYVAAPSICDRNLRESWSARGRVEAEAVFHGVIQAGYSAFGCPMIIGSHATFRTAALQAIGGFQRTLAEDHDNARVFATRGYRGAFALRADARGDGPATFADAMIQEFQWARALTQILLTLFPRDIRQLRFSAFTILAFGEIWYWLHSATMAFGHTLPFIALISGAPWVSVFLPEFVLRHALVTASIIAVVIWTRSRGWTRPKKFSLFSPALILFQVTRWPWMFYACLQAAVGAIARRDFEFRITPKGAIQTPPLPWLCLAPYLGVALAAVLMFVAWTGEPAVVGYLIFMAQFTLVYLIAAVGIIFGHFIDSGHSWRISTWLWSRLAAVALVGGLGVAAWSIAGDEVLEVVFLNQPPATATLSRSILATPAPWPSDPTISRLATVAHTDSEAAPATAGSGTVVDSLDLSPRQPDYLADVAFALGAYDPLGLLADDRAITVEHDFTPVTTLNAPNLAPALHRAYAAGRTPIVTLDPTTPVHTGEADRHFFDRIPVGDYDAALDDIAREVSQFPGVVYLRWAPEMELCGQRNWGPCRPPAYVAAYRYVVERIRQQGAANARFIWSPAGEARAHAFYPGADWVDVVGVTLFVADAPRARSIVAPDHLVSALQTLETRFGRYGKPLIVAQFGIALSDDAQRRERIADLFQQLAQRHSAGDVAALRGLVYFNDFQPRHETGSVDLNWVLSHASQLTLTRSGHQYVDFRRANAELAPVAEGNAEPEVVSTPTEPTIASRPADIFEQGFVTGVYDPHGQFDRRAEFAIGHEFIKLYPDAAPMLDASLQVLVDQGRQPLLSLEPELPIGSTASAETILEQIAEGAYDEGLTRVAEAIKRSPGVVYLRPMQEMELCRLHTWSACRPEAFQAAFRRIVTVMRANQVTNLRHVWSPAGEPSAHLYYPGDEWVDAISITMFISDQWAEWERTRPEPFARSLATYQQRFGVYGKPVFVAEFGSAFFEEADRVAYLTDVFDTVSRRMAHQRDHFFRGLVYFNDYQPERSQGISRPDWRLSAMAGELLADGAAQVNTATPQQWALPLRDKGE